MTRTRDEAIAALCAQLDAMERLQRGRLPVTRLPRREIEALPEYSCSLPTGTTIGKRWKRRIPYETTYIDDEHAVWLLGEYRASSREGYVDVVWSRIVRMTPREEQVERELQRKAINLLTEGL